MAAQDRATYPDTRWRATSVAAAVAAVVGWRRLVVVVVVMGLAFRRGCRTAREVLRCGGQARCLRPGAGVVWVTGVRLGGRGLEGLDPVWPESAPVLGAGDDDRHLQVSQGLQVCESLLVGCDVDDGVVDFRFIERSESGVALNTTGLGVYRYCHGLHPFRVRFLTGAFILLQQTAFAMVFFIELVTNLHCSRVSHSPYWSRKLGNSLAVFSCVAFPDICGRLAPRVGLGKRGRKISRRKISDLFC